MSEPTLFNLPTLSPGAAAVMGIAPGKPVARTAPAGKPGPRHVMPTSRDAWHGKTNTAEQREKVLARVGQAGAAGITLDELAAEWSVSPNTISGRFTELAAGGLLRRTTRRRATRSGASAVVWEIGEGRTQKDEG